jgi:hypothetical protein
MRFERVLSRKFSRFRRRPNRSCGLALDRFLDFGGHNTDDVYKFVKARQSRRIFACRGASESGRRFS